MATESDLNRYRAEAVKLRGDIAKASAAVAANRKKAAHAKASAGGTKNESTIRSKMRDVGKAERDAAAGEKTRSQLERRLAAVEGKIAKAQGDVDKKRAADQKKVQADQKRALAGGVGDEVDQDLLEALGVGVHLQAGRDLDSHLAGRCELGDRARSSGAPKRA